VINNSKRKKPTPLSSSQEHKHSNPKKTKTANESISPNTTFEDTVSVLPLKDLCPFFFILLFFF